MDIFNEVVGRHMGGQLIPVTRFGSTMQTFTPQWVVKDMIALLPDQVWNEHTTFLDISCKTGIFLMEIYKKLDEVLSKNPKYMDTATRRSHILNEQLYGLALDDKECLWYSSRNVYGRIGAKNMKYLHAGGNDSSYSYDQLVKNKKVEYMKALIQEEFGRNMFDVVVGNPPYNNDIYLDFVTLAKAIQTQNVCMITPAKWQAKGGPKNEAFRRDIVPYMSKIVYYPEATDLFDIQECDGITEYLLGSGMQAVTSIANKQDDITVFNDCCTYYTEDILKISLINKANSIVKKIKDFPKLNTAVNEGSAYFVAEARMYGWGTERVKNGKRYESCKCYTNELKYNVISVPQLVSKDEIFLLAKVRVLTFSSDNKNECESYRSFMESKFTKFLMLSARVGTMVGAEAKRFVPDPGKFDHIFTDQELYKKYNLTDEEISIIESVIKERK